MPTIRNRTGQPIRLPRVGRDLAPNQTVEVSHEQAAELAGHPYVEVTASKTKPEKEGDAK